MEYPNYNGQLIGTLNIPKDTIPIIVDEELDDTSTNPVQNKAVVAAISKINVPLTPKLLTRTTFGGAVSGFRFYIPELEKNKWKKICLTGEINTVNEDFTACLLNITTEMTSSVRSTLFELRDAEIFKTNKIFFSLIVDTSVAGYTFSKLYISQDKYGINALSLSPPLIPNTFGLKYLKDLYITFTADEADNINTNSYLELWGIE